MENKMLELHHFVWLDQDCKFAQMLILIMC